MRNVFKAINPESIVFESARIENSEILEPVKAFKDVVIKSSRLGQKIAVCDQSIVVGSHLEDHINISRRNFVFHSSIGRYTFTGANTTMKSAEIGRYCSISWNVSLGGRDHRYDCVSTSELGHVDSMWGEKVSFLDHDENKKPCVIGNDVWIATNVIILRGVTVGDGAVIGAGAVVTKNVESYSVVAGVPAKPMKKRFEEDAIAVLQKVRWWDWPLEVIRENRSLIYSEKLNDKVLDRLLAISKEVQNGKG